MPKTKTLILVISVIVLFAQTWSCADRKESETDRYCLTLDLREDSSLIREYRQLHTPQGIWSEIPAGIRQSGCRDMEIYLRDNRMFLIVEIDRGASLDSVWKAMGEQPKQEEWARFVRQFQQSIPGAPQDASWLLMDKVFDLDDH